jgi:PleD family two-component response regulator
MSIVLSQRTVAANQGREGEAREGIVLSQQTVVANQGRAGEAREAIVLSQQTVVANQGRAGEAREGIGAGGGAPAQSKIMILAVLDDLMFTSKIKTTASQLGVAVAFARSSASALEHMRKEAPSLVILDLNSSRTDPLGTVAAMKADGALAPIPTLGFVSHVQTDLIDAARRAGVGEVLARSAFTARLPEILAGESRS